MAAVLEEKLTELNKSISKEERIAFASKAHDIVGDIGHICLQDVTEKDIEYSCSLLFNKENGVLNFLRKTATVDEYQSSKAEILELLLAFLRRFPGRSNPYAVAIKDVCVSLFKRERFSRIKQGCIPVLIELLQQVSGSKVSNELNIDKLRDDFFLDIIQSSSKLTSTVKQQLFHILGVLSEVYFEKMISHADRLLDIYVKALKSEMLSKTRKPEFSIIAGCFQGLSHLLVNFTQSAEEGAKYSYDIYKFAKKATDPEVKMARYQMLISALALFERHAAQFNLYMVDEYEVLYEHFTHWSTHHNRDVMIQGKRTLEAFLKQISEMLVAQAEEHNTTKGASTFKYFIQKFRAVMDNPEADYKQVNLAIRGYGYFAAPCRMYMSEADVKFMFTEMIQRSEQVYLGNTENLDDKLINLPSFLDALASIVRELKQISDAFLHSLELLMVLLMQSFPKLGTKMHFTCFLTLLRILFALSPKGALFKGFLSRIVFEGVVFTCSHPILIDTEGQSDDILSTSDDVENVISQDEKPKISYRDYLPLWHILLECRNVKELTGMGIDATQRKVMGEAVYEELISSILKITNKLDLTSNRASELNVEQDISVTSSQAMLEGEGDARSDPIQGLHPTKPKDFIIFINLVDFAKQILVERSTHLFRPWVLTFGHEIIIHSTKLPLVSGFYKLLAVCMSICGKLHYFKGLENYYSSSPQFNVNVKSEVKQELYQIKKEETESQDQVMEESCDLAQREACFLLFSKFTKEVIVRLSQYKDDLLGACLSFILSLPREIVIAEINTIVPALKTTMQMGRSYLPLAVAGLDALDKWSRDLPPEVIRPYYADILPSIDAYLRTVEDRADAVEQTVSLSKTNVGKKQGKKKIPIKLLKNKADRQVKGTDTQLSQLRERCVYLLGSLGGSINRVLISGNNEEIAKSAVAWDTTKHLKFDIPFMDIKPTIYFDPFLPHIVELATTSSDRQTKVAACELLHSLIIYMVGRSATQPGVRREEQKKSMEELYRKLFPAMLKLACDVEQVSRQLFESLMMQLIHWFTGAKRYESPDTTALLDTILDGIIHPTDSTVRDFCAKCIKEFLHWSVKNVSKKEMAKRPFNVVSLLKRLYSLAKHPSAFKRLGAALAFNNIYTVFREEESLVDVFTIEILHEFVLSLAMAHSDEKSLGTVDQCKQVLSHIEKIMLKKVSLFLKPNKKQRNCPKGWSDATLLTTVKWLIRQCGRPQTECRHACMQLCHNLSPALPGIDSTKEMFDSLLVGDSGPKYFIQRFEGALYKNMASSSKHGSQGILSKRKLGDMDEKFSLKMTLNWFDMVLAAMDCYCWVFGQGLLSPSVLAGGNQGTAVFDVINHFLSDLAQLDLTAAASQFRNHENCIFTPHENEEYNRAKCTVIVRTLDFLTVCLGKYCAESLEVFPKWFLSDALWRVVIACALDPSSLGFNLSDVEISTNLPEKIKTMLQVISRSLPANMQKGFKARLSEKMNEDSACNLQKQLPISLQDNNLDALKISQVVLGYEQLQTTGLFKDIIKGTSLADGLMQSVYTGLFTLEDKRRVVVSLGPASRDLASKILSLAFSMEFKLQKILELLLDKSEVYNTSGSTSHHGALFYASYKSVINIHLVSRAKSFIPLLLKHAGKECEIVGNVLIGMVDHFARDKVLRKRQGASIVNLVVESWPLIQVWWDPDESATQETKTLTLSLLAKLFCLDAKVIKDTKSKTFTPVFNTYLSMLVDKNTSLAFKGRVLNLLIFYADLPQAESKKLKSKLDRLVADNFPSRSDEYQAGGIKYNDYITALDKLLYALEITSSIVLLEVLISVVCREEKHVYEDSIQNSIAIFIKRCPMDRQKPAADVAYSIFTSAERYNNCQRRAALERVCLSMLRNMRHASLLEFFTDHIKEIMTNIEARETKVSPDAMETQIVTKLCCYTLVEVMFVRLLRDDVCSKSSRINSAYCNGKPESGKEMAQTVTKMAHQSKQEDMRGETELLSLRREYHCAAYNTAIAVISCVQTDLKFYQGFLFSENTAKGQFLWENLVDEDRKYEFPVEMETPLGRRKKFVAIRNEAKDSRRRAMAEEEGMDGTGLGYSRSVHYLASQYLADSSLSADISQFDFSAGTNYGSVTPSTSSSVSEGKARVQSLFKAESIEESKVTVTDDYVEMEMDPLNQHECMASLTALLQHMHRNNITPLVTKGTVATELPKWMSGIKDKLQDSRVNKNVKLFLCKLIVNAEEVFRPYAKFWLSPIVHFITSNNEPINYFVIDLVVTILSWHTVAIPEENVVERSMASRLTEYLCSHCHHDTRSVLRNNLEVLKTLVEVWKSRIDVPTKALYENLSAEKDPKSQRNATGIQMVGVMVSNKLSPWRSGCGVDKDKFYQFLAMNMLNNYKTVYAATSEVVGMTIKHLEDTERGLDSVKWRTGYIDNIVKMLMPVQQTKPDQFVVTVHRMQLHYPQIANRFVGKILFMLPRVHGEFRTQCLSIIQHRVEHVDNIFMEMKDKGIVKILSHRDEESQLVALKLVHSMLRFLKPDELLYLMPAVAAFSQGPSADCRTVMFDVLMWTYDHYRDEDSEAVNKILIITKDTLLQGLSDKHLPNRLTVQNFWSHETRLPTATLDRLVAMLEAMYSPTTESSYLSYATNFILEMTSKSPDFNREIFEHPLSECKFEEYLVRSSWRQRHSTMAPLFATQSSQSQGSGDSFSMDTSEVRATQDMQQFTPTQQEGATVSKAPYNWLTQSSLDTFSGDYSLTQNTDTQSSLLFTVGKGSSGGGPAGGGTPRHSAAGRYGRKQVTPGGGKDTVDGSQGADMGGGEILRLKKRFLKDKAVSSAFFAKREAKKKVLREQMREEQKQRRENQVTMYRKYRFGDLPDIQIKYCYIIAPMQALAQRDSTIGRLLFSSIFNAIFSKIEYVKTERETHELTEKISQSLNNILSSSTQYYPPFISCILDIAREFPRQLKLAADVIHTVCTTSLQQPLGITLLEEMLTQTSALDHSSDDNQPASKRRRGDTGTSSSNVPMDTECWLELARLYKSIGDYDVLRGIFSHKLGTQEITSKALESEMKGDYQGAVKLYSQGLGQDFGDNAPSEVEMDLWEDSRLQCLDQLNAWDKLQSYTGSGNEGDSVDITQGSVFDRIWEDTFYMEHFFGYMLRSNLKLMLTDGDEGHGSLLTFVDRALKVTERKAVLENQYCEELALMYIWQDDYDRAKYYTTSTIQHFLQDWSGLDTLMTNSRVAKLQTVQKLTELHEFLEFITRESNFADKNSATQLIDHWIGRSADEVMDSTQVWDDIVTNRCLFIDHIAARLNRLKCRDSQEEDVSDCFEKKKVLLRLQQANSAQQQDNFVVAVRHMRNTRAEVQNLGDPILSLRWTHTYSTIQQRRALNSDLDLEDKFKQINMAIKALDKDYELHKNKLTSDLSLSEHHELLQDKDYELHKKILTSDLSLSEHHELLQGECVSVVTALLQHNRAQFSSLSDPVQQAVASLAGCSKKSVDEIISSLIEKGYQHLKTSVSLVSRLDDTATQYDTTATTEAHMSLVKYCDKYMRQAEEKDDASNDQLSPSFSAFAPAMVTSLLRAMKVNSTEARQRFPRLLQIVDIYPDTMDLFVKLSSEVPCWMFLGWLGQITALLDKKESPAIQDILMEIARQYPNALLYPFKLSLEGYKFEKSTAGKQAAAVCEKLRSMVDKNKLVNLFIKALEQMGQPNAIFKDFVEDSKLKKLMLESGKKKNEIIQEIYAEMYEDLFLDSITESEEDLYSTQTLLPDTIVKGEYRKLFAEKFRPGLDKLCGSDGSKLVSMNHGDFVKKAFTIRAQMDEFAKTKTGTPPTGLSMYSKFLSEFQASEHPDRELEIPGQYTGKNKPMPEYHTKVSNFSEKVMVLSSLRKPKTITIRGNDTKEYKYLVKGGEDLRQDHRIQQVFSLMNQIYDQDPVCRQRKLHLVTYQVIALTPRVGLIEWLENTCVLKSLIYGQCTDAENAQMEKPNKDHANMIGGNQAPLYHQAYKKYNRTETERRFRARTNMVPWDLLRRAYLNMAASTEAFFTLKCNLATSHAQICISQWVVGIGDRHLSNFMVDKDTGKMVGIDFGHAFGSASQFLPIPELMPFRMTRQIRNLTMPLREKGLVEGTMINTLRALRRNSDLLLATMDVFVKEPSVDWEQNAFKQIKIMTKDAETIEDLSSDIQWYPKEKIAMARKKLEGINPVYITRKEICLNTSIRPVKGDYEKVLMGDKSCDIRARLPEYGLSVEQQVASLLNQATDSNILGRVWIGWESWV